MNKILIILGFCISGTVAAQDIHFSQFFFAPQLLSPAETGNFEGRFAFTANHKSQWRSVSRPYQTTALGAEANGLIGRLPNLALGLQIFSDVAGDSRLTTLTFLTGGAYHFALDAEKKNLIYTGVQIGLSQMSINYSDLYFDQQYNGIVYNPNLPTGEEFARDTRWHTNLHYGLMYKWAKTPRTSVSAGLALHNLTAPNQSFFDALGVDLQPRFSLYANAAIKLAEQFDALPSVRWQNQMTYRETIAGAALRYILLAERTMYRSVFAGYYGRFSDSGIAMAGMEFDAWRVAISYDINLSDLETASRNKGGLELSLRYVLRKAADQPVFMHKFCPLYL